MRIGSCVAFKSANININALSDTHGELAYAGCLLENMKKNREDIFIQSDNSNANVFTVCGDWFMDGAKTGYKSAPNRKAGYFQLDIFNEFIKEINKIAKNTITLFTPGNHEFDGGVKLLDDIMSKLNAKIIMTNLDIKNSYGFTKTIEKNKLLNKFILNLKDDKNPDIEHKALFLGISPVNLSFYQKKLQGINLTDNVLMPQTDVKEDDYKETMKQCETIIKEFKKENPNGIVILMSHTGVKFADNLAKKAPVNLIFDGHEHKDKIRYSNNTPIIPLSMNFNKLVNTKIKINDNGKIENIKIKEIYPDKSKKEGVLYEHYKQMFKKDTENIYTIKSNNENIKELGLQGVRTGNSYLANFITDCILEELKKKDERIDFFALNSSSIRHPLKMNNTPTVSNMDIMSVLAGIKEEDGEIYTTDLSGTDITCMVIDNILHNKQKPNKNTLIQYAGLSINRTEIINAINNNSNIENICKFVTDTSTNKPIQPEKIYRIANVEKYFNKSLNKNIKKLKNISVSKNCTVQELLKQHFYTAQKPLTAKCDTRIV